MDALGQVGKVSALYNFAGVIFVVIICCIIGAFMARSDDNTKIYRPDDDGKKLEYPITIKQLGYLLIATAPLLILLGYLNMQATKSNKNYAALQGVGQLFNLAR